MILLRLINKIIELILIIYYWNNFSVIGTFFVSLFIVINVFIHFLYFSLLNYIIYIFIVAIITLYTNY